MLKTRISSSPIARVMIQASVTHGPVLNVVELDQVIGRCGFAPINPLISIDIGLAHACTPGWADQARPHGQKPRLRRGIPRSVRWGWRTRSDDAHLPAQHVHRVPEAPQSPARQGCDPRWTPAT